MARLTFECPECDHQWPAPEGLTPADSGRAWDRCPACGSDDGESCWDCGLPWGDPDCEQDPEDRDRTDLPQCTKCHSSICSDCRWEHRSYRCGTTAQVSLGSYLDATAERLSEQFRKLTATSKTVAAMRERGELGTAGHLSSCRTMCSLDATAKRLSEQFRTTTANAKAVAALRERGELGTMRGCVCATEKVGHGLDRDPNGKNHGGACFGPDCNCH